MGLDMDLYKIVHVFSFKPRDVKNITFVGKYEHNQHLEKEINIENVTKMTFPLMYWRKANAIHKWFVDNVQSGHDDCGIYQLSQDQLTQLYEICLEVLNIKEDATLTREQKEEQYKSLLPTCEGFFFGSTEYDDYYFDMIQDTKNMIEEEMNTSTWKDYSVDYEYHSSW